MAVVGCNEGGGGWYACGTKLGRFDHIWRDAQALAECKVKTLITPSSRCAALGMVEPELVGLPGKALTWDVTKKLRLDSHATSWLHSMVLHRHRCACLSVPQHLNECHHSINSNPGTILQRC